MPNLRPNRSDDVPRSKIMDRERGPKATSRNKKAPIDGRATDADARADRRHADAEPAHRARVHGPERPALGTPETQQPTPHTLFGM
jgi:hypothetical protein